MDESILLKAALFFSVIGIAVLFLLSKSIEVNGTTIDKITSGEESSTAAVEGTIIETANAGTATIITLSQQSRIKIIAFSDSLGINNGDRIKATGRVQDYKGEKELIADKIEIIK